MSNYTHETVPTKFIEAKGIRYAYRRFVNCRESSTTLSGILQLEYGWLGSGGNE
jgi:hypothetical protein